MKEDFEIEIQEDDLIDKILNSLQNHYKDLIDSIHVQMNSDIGVSLEYLKEKLRIKYHQLTKINHKKNKRSY